MAERPTTRDMLVAIDKKLDIHLEVCEIRFDQVKKHERLLYGNGSLGLKTKVGIMFWGVGIIGGAATLYLASMLKSIVGL